MSNLVSIAHDESLLELNQKMLAIKELEALESTQNAQVQKLQMELQQLSSSSLQLQEEIQQLKSTSPAYVLHTIILISVYVI